MEYKLSFLIASILIGIGFVSISETKSIRELKNFPVANATWQEHWFGHSELLTLVFQNDDLAVYFDDDVDRNITWPNVYLTRVWQYAKETYGNFGEDEQLYAVFHTGKNGGGHPSTYFDEHHDYKNAIDCGSMSMEGWISGQGNDLDIVTHEVSHIVEIASKQTLGSPAFPIWGDSKWAEIFNYDVYLNLGMEDDVTRWYNMVSGGSENFPRPNTFWFRDWFYPIYSGYGQYSGNVVLNRFFETLSTNFLKNGHQYARDLNFGEFVHFFSGAAGTNLKELATNAFGWPDDYEIEFTQAQIDFPDVDYN